MPTTSATDRIVVLHGADRFLAQEHTRHLREALTAARGEVDTIRFDGATARPADVLDECRSFGLMPLHKLVVVDDAELLVREESRPIMERYAESPSDSATLLLRAGGKWATKTRFDALVEKVGQVIKCEAPSAEKAAGWAILRAKKRHGCTLDAAAARAMVERLGADLGRLDTEIAKLAAAAAPSTAISTELISELVGRTREEDVWSFRSALLRERPEGAVRELRAICEASRSSPHIVLSWGCQELTRCLHAGGRMEREGVPRAAIGTKLRLWGPQLEPTLGAASRLDPGVAAGLFIAAVEADMRQKSGLGDPLRTLEMLTCRIASAVAGSSDKR